MLTKDRVSKLVNYWLTTANHDFQVMKSLYQSGHYSSCLFFGHIILEKVLKAWVVKVTREHALKTHNLSRLWEIARVEITESERELLTKVNQFNMHTRYPDEKLDFYKTCTRAYTDRYYQPVIHLYKKLCRKLK